MACALWSDTLLVKPQLYNSSMSQCYLLTLAPQCSTFTYTVVIIRLNLKYGIKWEKTGLHKRHFYLSIGRVITPLSYMHQFFETKSWYRRRSLVMTTCVCTNRKVSTCFTLATGNIPMSTNNRSCVQRRRTQQTMVAFQKPLPMLVLYSIQWKDSIPMISGLKAWLDHSQSPKHLVLHRM